MQRAAWPMVAQRFQEPLLARLPEPALMVRHRAVPKVTNASTSISRRHRRLQQRPHSAVQEPMLAGQWAPASKALLFGRLIGLGRLSISTWIWERIISITSTDFLSATISGSPTT